MIELDDGFIARLAAEERELETSIMDRASALNQKQSLPLEAKIKLTKRAIKDWYQFWQGRVYVAFSGGKDSTVLLHLVRSIYPEVVAVFLNTGLDFPEIRRFAKATDNVIVIKTAKPYRKIISEYGYPVISKEVAQKIWEIRTTKNERVKYTRLHGGVGKLSPKWHFLVDAPFKISAYCCEVLKKEKAREYEKETHQFPMLGILADESRRRRFQYINSGCNSYDTRKSRPMGFWKEHDVWDYLREYKIPYCDIYDMGYERTGCVGCLFGIDQEKPVNRIQLLKDTHPKLWKYYVEDLGIGTVMDYIGLPCE